MFQDSERKRENDQPASNLDPIPHFWVIPGDWLAFIPIKLNYNDHKQWSVEYKKNHSNLKSNKVARERNKCSWYKIRFECRIADLFSNRQTTTAHASKRTFTRGGKVESDGHGKPHGFTCCLVVLCTIPITKITAITHRRRLQYKRYTRRPRRRVIRRTVIEREWIATCTLGDNNGYHQQQQQPLISLCLRIYTRYIVEIILSRSISVCRWG